MDDIVFDKPSQEIIENLKKKEEKISFLENILDILKKENIIDDESTKYKSYQFYTTNNRKQSLFIKKSPHETIARILIHWGSGEEQYHLTHIKDISRESFSVSSGKSLIFKHEMASENDICVFSNPQIAVIRNGVYINTLRPKTYERLTLVLDFELSENMKALIKESMKK